MSEKKSPCLTGDHITSETILRAHFSAGGCVQVAGREYWYRMPETQLEMLCATSDEWVGSFRALSELVRTDKVIACDVPALAMEIAAWEKHDRERKADDEQVRRDVGAPRPRACIAPNGYLFPIGEELRLHLNEGGHVMINGSEPRKWYRMRANLLECLYSTSPEWQQSAWNLDDLVRTERVVACDEPQLSKDIRAREEADTERNAQKFARKFDEESWPPFKEKQMLHRDDGNDVSERDEYAMMFHIYNEQNRQVVFVMTCGDNVQSRSLGLMDAAKLHAALGVWLDQASRTEEDRCARNRR